MQCFMNENISNSERAGRVSLGMALVIGVLTTPGLPAWMAFICACFVLTALPAWDPLYAVVGICRRSLLPRQNVRFVGIVY